MRSQGGEPHTDQRPKSPPLANISVARFLDFGCRDYAEVLDRQIALRDARIGDFIPDTWLFGEHPPVITQGVRGQEGDVLQSGLPGAMPVVSIDRGGMATIHSPGQLILYPIVKLNGGSLAAGRLARHLLLSMQDWLESDFGVRTEFPKGRPGLFVGDRKLLSIGVSVRRGVSMHGIAMNLCNDLSLWSRIVACGEPQTRPITLSEILGRRIEPRDQRESIMSGLRQSWGYERVTPVSFAKSLEP